MSNEDIQRLKDSGHMPFIIKEDNPFVTEEEKELERQQNQLSNDAAAGNMVENLLNNSVMKNFMKWLVDEVENSKNLVFSAKSEENVQDLRIRGRTLIEVRNWFQAQIAYGKAAGEALERDQKEMDRINKEFGINTDAK